MKYLIVFFLFITFFSDIISQVHFTLKKELEINKASDTLLFQISGITTNTKEEIYISDKLDYKIKKFSPRGNLLIYKGRKGEGPEEFKLGPSNITYDLKYHRIAVIDQTTQVVKLFNEKLVFNKSIFVPKNVADIEFDDKGNLIVSTPPLNDGLSSIFIYNNNDTLINSFNPVHLSGNVLMDIPNINVVRKYHRIICLYRFRNLIQIYDYKGILQQEFSIPGLPDIAETETPPQNISYLKWGIPTKVIFWDLASDSQGNLYILGDDYSKHPRRDIYILNIHGKVIGEITLENESKYIYIDNDDNLYATKNEGTTLEKYRIIKNVKR
ncbi:hypothetical protein ABRY23_12805 [Melioribacteraceae bacterium 4301-Me]|uniref:hypothetical protein n=1 Tax=Pyranulibacter aquaticus TaxID=3163344 RepID=UPI003596ECD7